MLCRLHLTIGNVLRFILAGAMLYCLLESHSPDDTEFFLIAFFLLYLVYWLDILLINSTFKALRNRSSIESLHQKVVEMKLGGNPRIVWNIVCYHYETRTRLVTERDSQGRTYTTYETYEERVDTWNASQVFHFDSCIDMSPDTLNVDAHRYILWTMTKTYDFADDYTRSSYSHQKRVFEEANKWHDTHYSLEENFNIEGFKDQMITSLDGTFPRAMSVGVYFMSCIFLLELVYSAWLNGFATPQSYKFCKIFQCHNNNQNMIKV